MSEVKRFSPEYCEAGGDGWVEMQEDAEGAWCKASGYDALSAECERLRTEDAGMRAECSGMQMTIDELRAELTGADQALRESRANEAAATRMLAEVREELAALKGGREAVHQWGQDGLWSDGDEKDIENARAEGFDVRTLYTAPPAQANAWVAVSERLPDKFGSTLCFGINGQYADTTPSQFVRCFDPYFNGWKDPRDSGPMVTHWQPLPAAPTPGVSDGKGGK